MKKVLMAVLAAGLMVTSASALEGKITKVITKSTGEVKVVLAITGGGVSAKVLNGTADANKAMLAVALTANSTDKTVEMYDDGVKWTYISIIPTP